MKKVFEHYICPVCETVYDDGELCRCGPKEKAPSAADVAGIKRINKITNYNYSTNFEELSRTILFGGRL